MRPTQKAAIALIAGAVIHAVGGLAALRASGGAGPTRAARTGLAVAVAGSVVFVVAELASIAVRRDAWKSP